jgi:hypothetical protein
MPSLGELTVALGMINAPLRQGAKEVKGDLLSIEVSMRSVINQAGKLGLAVGAAGVAIVTGLVKSGLQAIDVQAKTARSINATVNGLRTLQLVTEDYGIENSELTGTLEKLNQQLGKAQREGGPAADMLKALGLNAADLARMDADDRIAAIADRVRDLGLSADQTADLLKEMGIRSSAMVDMLRHGGEEIRSAKQDLKDFGLELSQVDARKVEAAGDAIARIGRLWEAVRNAFTVALAPVLTELADRFTGAAKASGGFGQIAQKVVEATIRGFGKVLDVVHGLRVAFKAGEVVLRGFGAVVATVVDLGVQNFKDFAEFIHNTINLIIAGLNKIPGVDIDPVVMSEGFLEFADSVGLAAEDARNAVGTAVEELHALAMQELPSEKFEKFLTAVRDRANEAATEMENVQASLGGGNEGFGVDTTEQDEKDAEKLEKLREQIATRLEIIAEGLASEEELRNAQFAKDMETLIAAEEQKLITEEEFMIARQMLEEQHMDKLKSIREKGMNDMQKFMGMSFTNQAKTVAAGLAQMTASLESGSKTMFNINKVAGIANATIAMFQGIAEGVKLGWPLAIPAVAFAAAQGAAAIAGIKSQSFGGGGGASPTVAAGGALPTTPTGGGGGSGGGGGNDQVVRIQGLDPSQMFSGRQVAELLNSAVKDGAKLVLE